VTLEDYEGSAGWEDPLERVEEQAQIRGLVAKLPEDPKRMLLLKFVEGFSNAEIGEIMGRSEGAVKALLHRTLRKLRDDLTSTGGALAGGRGAGGVAAQPHGDLRRHALRQGRLTPAASSSSTSAR